MKTVKDTELKYANGDKILEGDNVLFEYYQFRAVPEKVEGKIKYKNGAFYIVSNLLINGEPAFEITLASIIENNSKIPHKHPMTITKLQSLLKEK